MSQMLGLGRLFNLGVSITTAKSRFSMRDYDQVGILMVGATAVSNLTLNECNAASGGTEQALAQVTQYWTQAVAGGTTPTPTGTPADAAPRTSRYTAPIPLRAPPAIMSTSMPRRALNPPTAPTSRG